MDSVNVKQGYQFRCLLLLQVLEQQGFCKEYSIKVQRHITIKIIKL